MALQTPAGQLPPGCLASVFEIALGEASNPNNGEYPFRTGWHESFEQGRDQALRTEDSIRLRITSEYPILQRGITEEQIERLESKPRYTPAPDSALTYEDLDLEPDSDSGWGEDEDADFRLPKGWKIEPKFHSLRSRNEAPLGSATGTLSHASSSPQYQDPAELPSTSLSSGQSSAESGMSVPEHQGSVEPPSTPPSPPENQHPSGSPSIHSVRLNWNQEVYRLVDFALLSIYLIEGANSRVILGRLVRPHGAYIPILAELESAPTRHMSVNDDNDPDFQYFLI
ncbi:hypothetical protein FRC11_008542 [Ceratobasidium sp. 423]|nr:hypothetical protein FRC11_008542 [Ceratobasidium sp. 423]